MTRVVKLKTNFAGQEIKTSGSLDTFSHHEALMKAFVSMGLCWLVGGLCVLVPILHFVLTPALVLGGPVAALIVYKKTQKLPKTLHGSVTCVHCNSVTEFAFENAKPPLYESCRTCKTGYEVLWPPIEVS